MDKRRIDGNDIVDALSYGRAVFDAFQKSPVHAGAFAVAGGVIGFFVMGPPGALKGAVLGAQLGSDFGPGAGSDGPPSSQKVDPSAAPSPHDISWISTTQAASPQD